MVLIQITTHILSLIQSMKVYKYILQLNAQRSPIPQNFNSLSNLLAALLLATTLILTKFTLVARQTMAKAGYSPPITAVRWHLKQVKAQTAALLIHLPTPVAMSIFFSMGFVLITVLTKTTSILGQIY